MRNQPSSFTSLPGLVSAGCLALLLGCNTNKDITAISYVCAEEPPPPPTAARCGAEDDCQPGHKCLPPEPTLPADPTDPNCILKASRITPPDGQVLDEPPFANDMEAMGTLDTQRIKTALASCASPFPPRGERVRCATRRESLAPPAARPRRHRPPWRRPRRPA